MVVKVLSGVVAGKVVAEFLGPAGYALTGNLRNFLTSVDTFSTLGVQNGIIKYVAENEKNEVRLHRILSTVFISIFAMALLMSVALFFSAGYLNETIFGRSSEYAWVFKVLAFTLPWHAGNIIFMAVINGLGKFKEVIAINMAGNVLGLGISCLLIWQLHIPGALLGLIITPALLFVFSFYRVYRQFKGFTFLKRKNFDGNIIRRLLSYSLMSVVTAILGPIIFITIRNTIVTKSGIDAAGLWEAINRISFFSMMFVTTLLTVYFLPKLSTASDNSETRGVFFSYFKAILPIFMAGCIAIYFLRGFIIRVMLSKDFLPMRELFFWQMVGDVFKVASLILGYQFFAKKMTRAFITTEIISFAVLYFSSICFIDIYGAEGAVMAHAFTYAVYFLVLCVWFRKILFKY